MPTRQQYLKNQQIIAARLAVAYIPKVYAALHKQIGAAVKAVQERGVMAAQGNIHGDILGGDMAAVLLSLYADAAKQAAKKFRPTMKAGFGDNPDFIQAVIDYFKKYLLNKVVIKINETTTSFINSVLDEAVQKGWGVDETVKRLEETDIPQQRARVIVRTESVRAMNYAQLLAADQTNFEMDKEWLAVHDKRTRLSHSNHGGIDGEKVPLDMPFSNGLFFPGDPDGPAKEVIQCRCTLAYIARRDANGRLIRKSPDRLPLLGVNGGITT